VIAPDALVDARRDDVRRRDLRGAAGLLAGAAHRSNNRSRLATVRTRDRSRGIDAGGAAGLGREGA
jgi:hypothetical protein